MMLNIYYETCAWTPDNVFWALMVVESLLCNFKWKSKDPFACSAEIAFEWFLGSGIIHLTTSNPGFQAMGRWA